MNMQLPAHRATIRDLCAARQRALDAATEAAEMLTQGFALIQEANKSAKVARGMGRAQDPHNTKAAEDLFNKDFDAAKSLAAYRKRLDADIWAGLMLTTGMSDMMDRAAKEEFAKGMTDDVPEASEENIHATMQTLGANAGLTFVRGLARGFSQLDKRFKSHDGFKIGSRVILSYMFDDWGDPRYGGTWDTLQDIERVFAVLDGEKPSFQSLRDAIRESRSNTRGARQSETEGAYFRIKGFKNGNAHLWFTRDDLVEKANQMLAKYYGATLPDAATENEKPTGTAVATKLQFYATPPDVVRALLRDINWRPGMQVLEPSSGEGAIVRALPAIVSVTAIEIHPQRAAYSGAICANFLTYQLPETFDVVVMNPPFFGTHWMDHVRKAFEHLKPGGRLRAVLPASAEVNETAKHIEFRTWATKHDARWLNLPPESFASSGTNVQTVILHLRKN